MLELLAALLALDVLPAELEILRLDPAFQIAEVILQRRELVFALNGVVLLGVDFLALDVLVRRHLFAPDHDVEA